MKATVDEIKKFCMNGDRKAIISRLHSPIRNYAVPGVTSWLIGYPSDLGCVRFFECSRDHQENVTPHSHRFDFKSFVLSGMVRNILWNESSDFDTYMVSQLSYEGEPGEYKKKELTARRFKRQSINYTAGMWYGMTHDEIHSIYFSRGTEVVLFEGPRVSETTVILEPFVDGVTIPTFEVKPWMFQKP